VAQFDRVIPPGRAGSITLRASTTGYIGKVRWQALIYSNDPAAPVETITVQGVLKRPIVLWPTIVFLKGPLNNPISKSVRIEGRLNKPFKIEPVSFNLSRQVHYEIVEIEAGKIYEIRFVSVPNEEGKYRGFLKLKTSYEEKPEIEIPVWGN
jgi:hypothetical protein